MSSNLIVWIKTIIIYTFPGITLIGLITNSISFYIFSRKRFQNTIFSTYFRFLLLFQTLNLILPINKMLEWNFLIYLNRISKFFCIFRYFYAFYNYSNASWILVVISFDRYLSISYPTKFLIRKKQSFQLFICLFIVLFNILYFFPSWFYYIRETITISSSSTNSTNQTSLKCVSPGIWFDYMNIIQQTLISFILMLFFTLLSIKNVFNSRKNVSTVHTRRRRINTLTMSKDMKFAISSITINLSFLLMRLPDFLITMISDYTNLFINHQNLFIIIQSCAYFLIYSNLCSTFFTNYFSNSMFKKELKIVFDVLRNQH